MQKSKKHRNTVSSSTNKYNTQYVALSRKILAGFAHYGAPLKVDMFQASKKLL